MLQQVVDQALDMSLDRVSGGAVSLVVGDTSHAAAFPEAVAVAGRVHPIAKMAVAVSKGPMTLRRGAHVT